MEKLFTGDMVSYFTQLSVTEEIWKGVPRTFSLAIGAALIWMAWGVCLGLLSAMIGERAGRRPAQILFGPLVLAGLASVFYWRQTELLGRGDLRPYLLVQFGSLAVIVLLLLLYPARWSHARYLWAGFAAYAAAKFLESADRQIFAIGQVISGHTLKHLAAAAGLACIVWMLQRRSPFGPREPAPDPAGVTA